MLKRYYEKTRIKFEDSELYKLLQEIEPILNDENTSKILRDSVLEIFKTQCANVRDKLNLTNAITMYSSYDIKNEVVVVVYENEVSNPPKLMYWKWDEEQSKSYLEIEE